MEKKGGGDAVSEPKMLDHVDVRMYEDGTSQVQFGPDFGRARAEHAVAILIHTLAADGNPGPSDQLLEDVRRLFERSGVKP
jgi:hypothetical protein